ncbi:MAG: DNA replication and repair protein RecF [Erysipelotrichaceae bacterium]|nr:MAG: DNA replication and repair protein [Erysipelotrichaceae bacterium]TXT19919.1 MAG: DNA replication and repair protein RecF [Erysipelotrichaceae bacterium]
MKIRTLSLRDFRNIASLSVSFHESITVLVGDNAQGKTNLLEAIYFLSTGRSHRVNDEQVCIRLGQESALIKGVIEGSAPFELKVVLHPQGKSLFYQQTLLKRSSEFIGKMNAVLFSPGDMELFDASPKARRRFMDTELGKINPVYVDLLSKTMKLLKDRNTMLKEKVIDETYLEVVTQRMIGYQVDVIRLRTAFIDRLNVSLNKYFNLLSLSQENIEIKYTGPVPWSVDCEVQLSDRYAKHLERDLFMKTTGIGIHRDDLSFSMNDIPVSEIASQGQRRMIVIALKCALLDVIEETIGEKPILLLDDVFSELDSARRKALFNTLHQNTQTVISTTDLEHVKEWLSEAVTIYEVSAGKIIERKQL